MTSSYLIVDGRTNLVKRFLITTADERTWPKDQPVLFLGEWCKLYERRHVWSAMDAEVVPYRWDDRKRLYKDYLFLDKLCEETLWKMTTFLNQIHRVDHSVRYWRIIIGPWLYYFTQVLYDRYQSILTAIECGKVKNTTICRDNVTRWLPNDFPCFFDWCINDGYNHYLYSRIIEHTGKIPFDIIETEDGNSAKQQPRGFTVKFFLKKLIELAGKFPSARSNQIVLISSYLRTLDLFKLQFFLKQIPCLYKPHVETPKVDIDYEKRVGMAISISGGEFEQFLVKMLIRQIPLIYLEGYEQMNDLSLKAYPQNPRIIFAENAHTNEMLKFWAAHNVDRGVKFVGAQHGGLYGAALWYGDEKHELKICDRYYSWGWQSDSCGNTKPMASIYLSRLNKNIHPKNNGTLLLIPTNMPRYFYHMFSIPYAANGVLSYFEFQYHFVRCLPDKLRKILLIRLYMHDYGWSQYKRWKSELPDVECYQGRKKLIDQLKECRLCIITYNATALLETLSANFPTILMWNQDNWELRPAAQPYYDKLNQTGILHYTPESAAVKVNEIYQDPMAWWQQPAIQNVRDEFCNQFAKTSENWMNEWVGEFNNSVSKCK